MGTLEAWIIIIELAFVLILLSSLREMVRNKRD